MKKLNLLIILSFISFVSYSQDEDIKKGEFWLGAQFGVPVGSFADKIERKLGYGGNLGFVFNPSKKSNFFQFGADFSLLYMGKDKKDVDRIPMKTTNTLIMTHAIIRFRAQTESYFKPYVDLLVGGKWFYTETKYNNDIVATFLGIEDKSIFGEQVHGAFSYGAGIGFSYRRKPLGVDFKVLYLKGGKIDYIAPENFYMDDDGFFYYVKESLPSTDMVFPQLSMSIDF